MSQSTFIRSIKATSVARNLIGRRSWSRLKVRSVPKCNSSCESGDRERLINTSHSFENLTMARLTNFGKIQPESVDDSEKICSTPTSKVPVHEKYTSLSERVLDLSLDSKEITLPEPYINSFRVPGDINKGLNKPQLRLQPVANPFIMPSTMVESSLGSTAILSRNLHSDTGQPLMAPRKFTTLMNKVELYYHRIMN